MTMCKGNRIRQQHKTKRDKTITITEPTSMNYAIRHNLRQFGAFTLFGSCPICGAFSMGIMRDVDSCDAEYYSIGFCGHKVKQLIHDYKNADFSKYVKPVSEEAPVDATAALISDMMASL